MRRIGLAGIVVLLSSSAHASRRLTPAAAGTTATRPEDGDHEAYDGSDHAD
jgi:hypothetical protein